MSKTDAIHYGFLGEFVKKDRDQHMVWAVATGPKVDLDLQRCDPEWLREAVPKWMKRGNVRQMHSTQLAPAGKAVEAVMNGEQEWVTGLKIVNKDAWELTDEGVYTGASIGVRNAVVIDDPTGLAKNGVICGGDIVELSLVDYPAYQFSELKTDRASLIKRAKEPDVRTAVEVVAFEPLAKVAELSVPQVRYAQPTLILPGKTAAVDAVKLGGGDVITPPVGPDGLPADAKLASAYATLTKADSTKPYGDVEYADPGYQEDGKARYPLDTEAHIRSAWSYINQGDNASAYSSEDLAKVKAKIKAAMKRIGADVSDDDTKAAGAEEKPIAQDDDEEHDMDDPNLGHTRGRKVPSQTHVDPQSTSPDVVTLATLPDGTKIETSTRKDLTTTSGEAGSPSETGLQEPHLNGKSADSAGAHNGRVVHDHTHQTANAAHGVDAGDSHSHEHEHDDSADHDVAPHPDYSAAKAAEPETTKAADGVELSGDEAQHNGPLEQARTAIKALISQELAENEPEIECVEQLTSIWRQLEWWAQNEAAEAAGIETSPTYAYWEAVATLAKHNTAKTAKAWAPALIATGESLMTQAKAAQAVEQPSETPGETPKAAEPEVAKEGRTISAATATALLDIASATGMPADAAARLRALAGEVDDAGADSGKSSSTEGDGPTGIDPIPLRLDPATLQLTSREATGIGVSDTSSTAFERAANPDLTKYIHTTVAETVGQVLKVVLPEALKGVAPAGAVAKAADAVEATHEDATTKIAALRDELTKVAGLPTQLADLQKRVTDEIAAIKQLADNRVPVATEGVRPVEKNFVGNHSSEDETVAKGRDIFERAAKGDPEAQRQLQKAFGPNDGRDVAVQAYAATTPHRG